MTNRLITKFQENYRGFWKDYRWFIAVFVLALFCDAASTIRFMLIEGSDAEIHLAIRFVSKIFGPVVGPLVGVIAKAMVGILIAVYCRRFAIYIFLTASIVSFWAAWYNIWGVKIYTPNMLKWIPW